MKGQYSDFFETPSVEPNPDAPPRSYLDPSAVWRHAGVFLGLILVSLAWVIYLLHHLDCQLKTAKGSDGCGDLAAPCWQSPPETTLLALALACGIAGGLIHATTSFTDFAGNRRLVRSWLPWLYLRAPVAALLALAVYLGARAGVFGLAQIDGCSDVYLLAFMAALSGLFSKQVTDKLADVVDVLFKPSRPPDRTDSLQKADSGRSDESKAAGMDETIHRAQILLVDLGLLPELDADGKPLADGVLGPKTREAVEQFLAENVTEEDRAGTVGEESDPDYWHHVIALLEQAIRARG